MKRSTLILAILLVLVVTFPALAQDQEPLPPSEVEITEVNPDDPEQTGEETEEANEPEEEDQAQPTEEEIQKEEPAKSTSETRALAASGGPAALKENTSYQAEPVPDTLLSTGAGTYGIPIKVLPGRNGLAPNLSLSYNSFRGNSWVGLGWNLGLGSIRRSTKRGLNYTDNTHFYADGDELLPRPGWGENYFGLKIESGFAKYHFDPTNKNWEVTAKDGTKYFYGSVPETRQGKDANNIFAWLLDKVQDTNGNYYTVTYVKDQGELYLSRIDYTGHDNPALAPTQSVKFILEDRPDPLISYVMQAKAVTAKRLAAIEIFAKDNALFRVYKLTYEALSPLNFSRLAKVEIIGSDRIAKLPGINLEWMYGGRGLFNPYQSVQGPGGEAQGYVHFADLNGDRKDDLIKQKGDGTVYVALSQGNGTFGNFQQVNVQISSGAGYLNVADINSDGKADLVTHLSNGNTYTYLSNGDGTFTFFQEHSGSGGAGADLVWLADINGDGAADLIKSNKDESGNVHCIGENCTPPPIPPFNSTVYVYLSKKDGTFETTSTQVGGPGGGAKMTTLADVNGDGYADLVKFNREGTAYIFLSNGKNGFSSTYTTAGGPNDYLGSTFGDVNGDGLADLVKYNTGNNVYVYLSKSDGTFDTTYIAHNGTAGEESVSVQLADMNNDGYADLVKEMKDGQVHIYFSLGNGAFETVYHFETGPGGGSEAGVVIADVDGNGILDLAKYTKEGFVYAYIAQGQGSAGLMTKVRVSNGASIAMAYTPSSQFPQTKMPFIMHLVSSKTVNDGLGNLYTTTYTYADGVYEYEEREFRGFGYAGETNPDGTMAETWFHQGEYDQGLSYKSELWEPGKSTLMSKQEKVWEIVMDLSGCTTCAFVKLNSGRVEHYDKTTVFNQSDYVYDETGNLTRTTITGTDAATLIKEYAYQNLGPWLWRQTVETLKDSQGVMVRKSTDDWQPMTGNLLSRTAWLDGGIDPVISMTYDAYGNLKTQTNALGYVTSMDYDSETQTFLVRETLQQTGSVQHVSEYGWDYVYAKPIWAKDENNNVTNYHYDVFGRRTQVDQPDGGQTGYFYYDTTMPRALVTRVKENSQGSFIDTYQYFDGLSRSVQTLTLGENNKSIVSRITYDNMGRVWRTQGPYFSEGIGFPKNPLSAFPWTETTYDYRGRPILVQAPHGDYPEGIKSEFFYEGLVATAIDPDGFPKTQKKDFLGRIIQVTEYVIQDSQVTPHNTKYEYNAAGDLKKVINALGHESRLIYDSLGRKTDMWDPDMGHWTYTYDKNGNLKTQIDAKGQKTRFEYDELDRVLSKSNFVNNQPSVNTSPVTYVYDNTTIPNGKGRLYSVIRNNVINRTDSYDKLGRALSLSKIISGVTYTTQSEYDLSGKTKKLIYPDNTYVTNEYYPGTNLLQSVTDQNQVVHGLYTDYEPTGKIGQINHSNGTATKYTYDPLSTKLFGIVTINPSGQAQKDLQNKTYTYSRAGDIWEIKDHIRNVTYSYAYDTLHRLVGETLSGEGVDPADETVLLDYQYDNPAHVHAVSKIKANGAEYNFSYDLNGNMETSPDLTELGQVVDRTIQYDGDNMPVRINRGAQSVDFTYDGLGRRVKKTVSGGTTTLYIGEHYEVKGGVVTKYIFGGNLRLAVVKGANTYYYHKDHLGSTAAVTDAVGNKSEGTEYLPFGSMREHTGDNVSDYKFTDQELDNETGLYNYDARLYDPVLGMFVTPDSIVPDEYDPQELNRYAYCRNNPLIYVDPSGHVRCKGIDEKYHMNDSQVKGFLVDKFRREKERAWHDFVSDVLKELINNSIGKVGNYTGTANAVLDGLNAIDNKNLNELLGSFALSPDYASGSFQIEISINVCYDSFTDPFSGEIITTEYPELTFSIIDRDKNVIVDPRTGKPRSVSINVDATTGLSWQEVLKSFLDGTMERQQELDNRREAYNKAKGNDPENPGSI